jgi:hypothetical protein
MDVHGLVSQPGLLLRSRPRRHNCDCRPHREPHTVARRHRVEAALPLARRVVSVWATSTTVRSELVPAAPAFVRLTRSTVSTQEAEGEEPRYDGDGEDEGQEQSFWDAPLEATWEGWDDPTPENFLVVLLSAVTVVSVLLVSLRLGVVLVSIFLTGLKYCAIALLLVIFAVYLQ